jgi:hypothetical protein
MATIKTNPIIEQLSGGLGRDLLFRRLPDGRTILCAKPDFSRREFSQKQLSHQQRFRAAAAYAKSAAKTVPIYTEIATGSMKTAYNVALSDWFHPPEIVHVDCGQWTGEIGSSLIIQAEDDVLVKEVRLVFLNSDNEVLEETQAEKRENGWWQFLSRISMPEAAEVLVSARDLAGNETEMVVTLISSR